MEIYVDPMAIKRSCRISLLVLMLGTASHVLRAQAPTPPVTTTPAVPDWAQPGSPTHVQVPPPADFHRPSRNFDTPIGLFQGQSDISAAVVAGSASYDASTKQYTIHSAGYSDADGSNIKLMASDTPSYFHGWSPDNKTLAFVAQCNGSR